MEATQNINTNDSAEERLRRLEKAHADFLASIREIDVEQKKLGEQVRLILEKARMKKVLQKIVSIK